LYELASVSFPLNEHVCVCVPTVRLSLNSITSRPIGLSLRQVFYKKKSLIVYCTLSPTQNLPKQISEKLLATCSKPSFKHVVTFGQDRMEFRLYYQSTHWRYSMEPGHTT